MYILQPQNLGYKNNKIKEFYCEVPLTSFIENPQRDPAPCLYAIRATQDSITFLTSAFLNNLYLAVRDLVDDAKNQYDETISNIKTDFYTKYSQAWLNDAFNSAHSNYGHLTLTSSQPFRSVFILFQGRQIGEHSTRIAGSEPLTTENLTGLINGLSRAGLISDEFKLLIESEIEKMLKQDNQTTLSSSNLPLFSPAVEQPVADLHKIKNTC